MRLTLPIRWRGAWLNLPLDMEYQVLFGQPNVMAAWMNGADVWPQLSQKEREVLRAHVLANLQQNGCGATQALAAARKYWADAGNPKAGFMTLEFAVVDRGGQVVGAMESLRKPATWPPGYRAVSLDGTQYLAAGGDAANGAERWELIAGDKPHLPPELREFAQQEQEAALAFSEAQKGARHVR